MSPPLDELCAAIATARSFPGAIRAWRAACAGLRAAQAPRADFVAVWAALLARSREVLAVARDTDPGPWLVLAMRHVLRARLSTTDPPEEHPHVR
jgi:hypothetical protein